MQSAQHFAALSTTAFLVAIGWTLPAAGNAPLAEAPWLEIIGGSDAVRHEKAGGFLEFVILTGRFSP